MADRLHARRVFDPEDNPFLADFYKEKPGSAFRAQMYFLMERYRRYFWKYAERAVAADSEHESIMKAALDRDEERATNLLQAHFQKQAKLTMTLRKKFEKATVAG